MEGYQRGSFSPTSSGSIRHPYLPLQAYARVSGAQVDELWRLVKARQINPIWHLPASALDLEDTGAKSVVKHTGNKRVTIEEERNNGYDSMPELLSASESEDSGNETDTDFSDTESEEEKTDGPDDESTDDSEEDEEMRTMIKQAWEHVMSDPQLFGEDVKDSRVEERKENHFIKLLSNLRGTISFFLKDITWTYHDLSRSYVHFEPCFENRIG